MSKNLGFMQGRLSNIIDGKIQCFPWDNWENEFKIASENKFNLMEWTLDHERLYENPLMNYKGKKRIFELCKKYNLKVKSLTGDCFMQRPFWKNAQNKNYLKKCLEDVIICCSDIGINIIVIPLVDNGSLENKNQELELISSCKKILPLIKAKNVKIAFEIDYEPKKLKSFINKFDDKFFGINYDIGNSASLGFCCEDEIKNYGNKIFNVHIKDRKYLGGTVPLGLGNANFNKVFKHLREISYKGNYILQAARSPGNGHIEILNEYRLKVNTWMREC